MFGLELTCVIRKAVVFMHSLKSRHYSCFMVDGVKELKFKVKQVIMEFLEKQKNYTCEKH